MYKENISAVLIRCKKLYVIKYMPHIKYRPNIFKNQGDELQKQDFVVLDGLFHSNQFDFITLFADPLFRGGTISQLSLVRHAWMIQIQPCAWMNVPLTFPLTVRPMKHKFALFCLFVCFARTVFKSLACNGRSWVSWVDIGCNTHQPGTELQRHD